MCKEVDYVEKPEKETYSPQSSYNSNITINETDVNFDFSSPIVPMMRDISSDISENIIDNSISISDEQISSDFSQISEISKSDSYK